MLTPKRCSAEEFKLLGLTGTPAQVSKVNVIEERFGITWGISQLTWLTRSTFPSTRPTGEISAANISAGPSIEMYGSWLSPLDHLAGPLNASRHHTKYCIMPTPDDTPSRGARESNEHT